MKIISTVLLLLLLLLAPPAWAQWQPWNDLPAHCSQIIVIRGEQDRNLVADVTFQDSVQLMYPGPQALAATKAALLRMTPLLCLSIRRIAFGRVADHRSITGAVNSFGSGDLILINLAHQRFYEEDLEARESSRLMLQGTLIHEAAHAAETLLGAESKDGGPTAGGKKYSGSWNLPARKLARETIKKVRLENGLYKEWQRLHRSFVDESWAARYDNDAYQKSLDFLADLLDEPSRFQNASSQQIAEGGFMGRYGAGNWAEDLATFVTGVYIGPEMASGIKAAGISEDLREDSACREMQAHQDKNVTAKLAAVYTKVMFLVDIGLIKEQDAKLCTGSNFGLVDVSGQGFYFFEQGELQRSFENSVKAGMGAKGIGNVFEMRSEGQASFGGKSYPANMKLSLGVGVGALEQRSWPRGVYKLGLVGPNGLVLRLDGAKAGNFNAKDAYVLVASSSAEYISGSVFLTQAWRAEAPMPVPQVFDPPLHIRFQLKK